MAQKSKVKSYARRTKSGISRVTGHSRNSDKSKRNRNIAIGAGIGTSILTLGLGAKYLSKKKGLKGNATSKPKIEVDQIKSPYTNKTPNTSTTKVDFDEAIDTEFGKDNPFVKSDKPKPRASASDEPIFGQTRKMTTKNKQLDELNTYEPSAKRRANSERVRVRRQDLMLEVSYDPKTGDFPQTFFQAGKTNKNRLQRKQAGKKLADAARDLRSRGMYPNNPKPKTKRKTNKLLDETLTGKNYSSKPKNTTPNIFDRVERLRKWDANRGVVIRRKKLLEESLGQKLVDKTKGRLDFNPTPKSRKARKKAAKQVAAEAKRLRDLGEYY